MNVQFYDISEGKEKQGLIGLNELNKNVILGLYEENLIGTIDNTNKVFTTTNEYIANSTILFINGLKQRRGVDYTETGTKEITLDEAPMNIGIIDELRIMYRK